MGRKKKKIKNQIVFTYSFFIIVLLTGLSLGFYFYNLKLLEEREYKNMQNLASKTMEQVENLIKDMDSVALEVIYNKTVVDRLSSDMGVRNTKTAITDVEVRNQLLIIESFRQIINKKVNRVSVFDEKGHFFTTKKSTMTSEQFEKLLKQAWVIKTKEYQGKKWIRPPFVDHWDEKNAKKVISLNRWVRVSDLGVGYVEIQQDYSKLEEVFSLNLGLKYVLLDEENQLVYSSVPVSAEDLQPLISINPDVEKIGKELIYIQTSKYLKWHLIVLQDVGIQITEISIIRNLTILTGIFMIICSMVFITLVSRLLTKPITRLICNINALDLNHQTVPIEYDSKYDETNKLNDAFQALYKRLNEAIKESYRFQNMQLKAHFDVLQAQINPHFMYNTLGIIANMGDEAKQQHISDACYGLIDMLRYTNDVNQQWTTIGDEMEHTGNYLMLMKKRYEHRLNYHIQIEEKLLKVPIPKLILQPLVENSLQHGFDHVIVDTMKVSIVGKVVDDRFEITISDNGSGFDADILQQIKAGLETYKDKILTHSEIDALTMGGMGILSTFARLFIFFKEDLTYTIQNNEVGMSIVFGGQLPLEKEVSDGL